jgi:hypothetical protein
MQHLEQKDQDKDLGNITKKKGHCFKYKNQNFRREKKDLITHSSSLAHVYA